MAICSSAPSAFGPTCFPAATTALEPRTTTPTPAWTPRAYQQHFWDTKDAFTVNARFTREVQKLNASQALGLAQFRSNTLNDFRVDASYYWRNKIGGTVAVFDTTGSADPLVYAGNRTFKPDSSGMIFQLDGTPWGAGNSPFGKRFNMRLGAQYTLYNHFDGAGRNYDGFGHNASANNTFRLFTWFAY